MILAVCGKGGVGKTTISAIAARALTGRTWLKSLIVDGDPSGGLAMALSLNPKTTLEDVRLEIIEAVKSGQRSKSEVAASMDYLLTEALVERGNLAFLGIGRPEDPGCYCRVNSFLKNAIRELADSFDMTVMDAEAGIEQVNREVMGAVDYLLLVSDTSAKGIKVAETIVEVAERMVGGQGAGLVFNRVREGTDIGSLQERTSLDVVGWIPEDETVRTFDEKGRSFFELPECPAEKAVVEALKRTGLV